MARSEHHATGLLHYNPALAFRGYTLFTAGENSALLIDMHGRIVHRWQHPDGLTNAELLPNGHLMALALPSPNVRGQRGLNGQSAACMELDWDGNVVWEYRDPWLHHDYQRLANGNTLLVRWESIPKRLAARVRGGYNEDGDDATHMLGDHVFEVDAAGRKVRSWKSWRHFDTASEVICPLDHRLEWSHCNSVAESPQGNWLLSFRRISLVCEVAPDSGEILWRWTGETSHQHDAHYTPAGTITVFDNGVHRRGIEYSRVLEVSADSREILWQYADDPPFSFYTLMGGSAQRLPNGNTLVCETSKGQFFEVTPDRKVVWDYINPMFIYNPRLGGRMNMVFRARRYGPDHAALADRDLDPDRFANLNRLYA